MTLHRVCCPYTTCHTARWLLNETYIPASRVELREIATLLDMRPVDSVASYDHPQQVRTPRDQPGIWGHRKGAMIKASMGLFQAASQKIELPKLYDRVSADSSIGNQRYYNHVSFTNTKVKYCPAFRAS